MDVLQLIVVLIVLGLLLWAVEAIPLDPTIRQIIRVVAIVAICLWLLSAVGLLPLRTRVGALSPPRLVAMLTTPSQFAT